jgi:cellulose synthase/poly-beta-1,6-N-acetylglucosamine synthase-like glycosyltransferase
MQETDLIHICLLRVYRACIAVVWLYSFSRWKNLLVALWLCATKAPGSSSSSPRTDKVRRDINTGHESSPPKYEGRNIPLPAVTVQIVSYNEGEVVPITIAKACELDWPKDRLFIHVLDDSTDPESVRAVKEAVNIHRLRGIQIEYKSRPDRYGYKAGNLAHHFDDIQTDLVLYLDGDHQVESDLLQRTVKFFHDCPKLALVQAPWGYYNAHANLLTECDALGLDIHHTVEQQTRAHLHKVFGFNGTGGVWRKQAIEDAGGWTWDTVTEDLSIR